MLTFYGLSRPMSLLHFPGFFGGFLSAPWFPYLPDFLGKPRRILHAFRGGMDSPGGRKPRRNHVIPFGGHLQPHMVHRLEVQGGFSVRGELVKDCLPSGEYAPVVLVAEAFLRDTVLAEHPADLIGTQVSEFPLMRRGEYILVGGQQQALLKQARAAVISGHPVYFPGYVLQLLGKVAGLGGERYAAQPDQRAVDVVYDVPFPAGEQVRAVLPEIVTEDTRESPGIEELAALQRMTLKR